MTHIFFIEGQTEKAFLELICGEKAVIRLIGVNGSHVPATQVAQRIITLCRAMRQIPRDVVVFFDREKRAETCEGLVRDVTQELHSAGIDAVVGVADRSIETWICYSLGEQAPDSSVLEGRMGAGQLKKIYGNYSKVQDGPYLLKAASLERLRRSPSFEAFFQKIASVVSCWWLKRTNGAT